MWIISFALVVLNLLFPSAIRTARHDRDVLLNGMLDGLEHSALDDKAVRVYLDSDAIYIQFFTETGSVDVVLMDNDGALLTEDLIDTTVNNYMSIAIPEDAGSDFVIQLSNAHGQMEGHFSID